MKKIVKLSAVAAVAAFGCLTYLYFYEYSQLSLVYRCWRHAVNISACYTRQDFDFRVTLNGTTYEGNTNNYIDKNIFLYGAYEKPVLFFLSDIMITAYSDQGIFLDIGANTGQHSLFMSRHAREIHAFRAARSPAGLARTLSRTVITTYGSDFAVASTLFHRPAQPGKIGRQQQTWARLPQGWRIVAAHVSMMDEPQA